MAQKNDQVFQLSLTEIAFMITFILLLLLGYLVVSEQSARLAAESSLDQVQSSEDAAAALDAAKTALARDLERAGGRDPENIIKKLILADDVRAERDRLKQSVVDLDAKLTALSELQKSLEEVAMAERSSISREEVQAAMALQDQVRRFIKRQSMAPPHQRSLSSSASPEKGGVRAKEVELNVDESARLLETSQRAASEHRNAEALARVKQAFAVTDELHGQVKSQLGKEVKEGQEIAVVRDLVAASKTLGDVAGNSSSPEAVKKENSDLRGQVAFLKNRLDARGGRDYPPCWADETGKVEFLFSVEVRSDSVDVNRAWPARRDESARSLFGSTEILGAHSYRQFSSKAQNILNWSKRQDPECRHYVQLKSSISNAVQSDRARLMVENYFYKVEVRR